MKIKFKKVLILTLTMIMMLPQTANAGWGNGKVPNGQLKKIERYQEMDQNKIRVKNRFIQFDVPPVLKDNRTLIPVRALTEALGCDVEWVEPKAYIISPETDKIMVFDLEIGKVYVAEGWTFEELLAIDSELVWNSLEVSIDVPPGLVNNRTFVPLRFIAEELGLIIGYNKDTGVIDIDEEPEISPSELVINEVELLPTSYKIDVELNDFDFDSIEGLSETVDYTVNADDDIILTEAYLKSITKVTTNLVIVFVNDTEVIKESFVIKLNYLTDLPVLTPNDISFTENETSGLSYLIDMDLFGFELIQISSTLGVLTPDTDYNVLGDRVTIKEAFLEELSVGTTELSFLFLRNTVAKTIKLTIHVLDAPELNPVIEPSSMVIKLEENLPETKEIDMTLNDYTLKEVIGLEEDIDYTLVDDVTLTLLSSYLEELDVPKTILSFVFEKDNVEDVILTFTIELEYLYIEPVLTPDNVTFKKTETAGLQVLVDMELYGFELSNVIDHSLFLIEDTDYEVDETNSDLILKENYLSTIDVGSKTLTLMFVRELEVVFLDFEIVVTE